MAQVLDFSSFYQGESRKQSGRRLINYMRTPGDQGEFSPSALFSTTGIEEGARAEYVINGVITPYIAEEATTWKNGNFPTLTYIAGNAIDRTSNELFIPFSSYNGNNLSRSSLTHDMGFSGNFETTSIRMISTFDRIVLVASVNNKASNARSGSVVFNVEATGTTSSVILGGSGLNASIQIEDLAYFGNRFVYLDSQNLNANRGRIYFSGINDPTNVGATAFYRLISQNGQLIGLHEANSRLYVFTDREMAVFDENPANNPAIPFVESEGSSQDVGLVAAKAKHEFGGTLYFIGTADGHRKMFAMPGGVPQIISTPEIEYLLGEAGDLSNARVFSIVDQGRSMICFSFGTYTLCYDIRSQEFHERGTETAQWPVIGQSEISHFVSADLGSGFSRVASPDSEIGTEFGSLVERLSVSSNYNSDGMTNRVSRILATGEVDYTNYTTNYTDPNLSVSISDDFGNTYQKEKFDTFGELGNHTKQMSYRNMGVFGESFTVRLKTKNPYPHRINKVLAKIQKGRRQI